VFPTEIGAKRELALGEWRIGAVVDDDGHLTLWVSNTDESKVYEIDAGEPDDFQIRLTTVGIEDAHGKGQS
jgi:hypothetical protein